jgi:hypothetical protein
LYFLQQVLFIAITFSKSLIIKSSFRFLKCAALLCNVSSHFGKTFYFLFFPLNFFSVFSSSIRGTQLSCVQNFGYCGAKASRPAFHDNCKWPFRLEKNQQAIILCYTETWQVHHFMPSKKLCRV